MVNGTTAGCTGPGGVVTIPAGQELGTPDLYFDPCAFVLPPPAPAGFPAGSGFYGNAGRNIIIGPGLLNFDLSLQKSTPLGFSEAGRLEFRADFFNLLNHANFRSPGEQILNPTNRRYVAGAWLITGTTTTARQLQLGLRITF
jgi:hypothetical protein